MRTVALLALSLLAVGACKPRALTAEDYAKGAEAEHLATSPESAPGAAPNPTDVMPSSNTEYLGLFEAKGIHLGMSKDDVAYVMTSKGFFLPPDAGSPMMEMVAELPTYSAADSAYIDTPQCRAEIERHRNFTRDETNSMSNLSYRGCDLAIRIFYDADNSVIAFYVKPTGFGLEQMDIRQFAEAVVQNLPVAELNPETQPIRTLGQSGICTNFVGQAAAGERINVSDCGFLRMQVQKSASASGDFQ